MTDAKSHPYYNTILDDLVWKEAGDNHAYSLTMPPPFIPMASLPKTKTVGEHTTTVIQTPYHLDHIIDSKTVNHDLMEMLDDHDRRVIQKRLNDMQAAYYEKALGTPIETANPPVEPLSIDAMLEWFRMIDEMLHRRKADQVKALMKAGVMVSVNRSMPAGSMVMTVSGDYERAVEIALEEFAKEKARG